MAKNDQLLLDGIIDDRIAIKQPSEKRDEAFEYFAFEQLLKDYDLSSDEILHGSIDGRQDGGIDGFFILVNGLLLQDYEAFVWPRTNSELRLALITCKHHDTFKQATLDALISTISEILDFSIEDSQLTGAYSSKLLAMRNNLRFAYRKLSPRLASFAVNVYYASRGDSQQIGAEVSARGNQIVSVINNNFGSCEVVFSFVGSNELVELHRKIKSYTLELPFVEALAKGERYVVLAKLTDYFKFISNEGKLRRYLFDSNVRDFMGLNRVNNDIRGTLENDLSPDFWWLNNGVTILATSAAITGKSIQADGIQIVNGLQTTESIFRHFASRPLSATEDRCVLVKVIVTNDEAIRDAIIRATNNQTDVEQASLHATDKIQRDIEDVLFRNGLFYERRKNFYANQGHVPADLVTPLYAAAGFFTLVIKRPDKSPGLRQKFMRNANSYNLIFGETTPLEVWPKIVKILKKVDVELELLRPLARVTDNFLKGWRYIIAFLLVSKHFKRFTYSIKDLIGFDVSTITSDTVREILEDLNKQNSYSPRGANWTSFRSIYTACEKASIKYEIQGLQAVKQEDNFSTTQKSLLTEDFIAAVKAVLPAQPWKPGIHKIVSTQLRCSQAEYFSAVERLIEEGHCFKQKDGVLYDHQGNVIGFDPERVNPDTLELLSGDAPNNLD